MIKEDFSPENIKNFVCADENGTLFCTGSYQWFNGKINEFVPHDYDYCLFIESDNYSFDRTHYMWMDLFIINYKKDGTKKEFIEAYINGTKLLRCVDLLNADICKHFKITWNDLTPYLDKIEEFISEAVQISDKYDYLLIMFHYMCGNASHELTEEQLKDVYESYAQTHKNKGEGITYEVERVAK